MENKDKRKSRTWFDCLPTEIIFLIFDYLSNNDISYTFFNFNDRMTNLLFKNQRYFRYFELPSRNLHTWEDILFHIGSKIQCLNIIQSDFCSYLFKYLSNLKILIISCLNKEIDFIIESKQFENLEKFIHKQDEIYLHGFYRNSFPNQDNLIKKILINGKRLKELNLKSTFYLNDIYENFQLHSITINTILFENIFLLVKFLPNLEYLNIETFIPHTIENDIDIDIRNIKLKQLYLTLHYKTGRLNELRWENSFDQLINYIHKFSSTLICLSLNLIYLGLTDRKQIPFNSLKLQEFLEPMIKLKEFYLYSKLIRYSIDYNEILSGFKNKFWFNHNWFFGMHQQYFYTLPFHFHSLYEFNEPLNHIKSSKPEILIHHPKLWFSVRSIQLEQTFQYDFNWIKEINLKLPKLNSITFSPDTSFFFSCNRNKSNHMALNNVTMIRWGGDSIEILKEWFVYVLPNVKHFRLSFIKQCSIDKQLIEIFDKQIQRLDIDSYSDFEQLTQITSIYFSNVKYISFGLNQSWSLLKQTADFIKKILKNFHNLQIFIIYKTEQILINSNELMYSYLNTTEINEIYQIKYVPHVISFHKLHD